MIDLHCHTNISDNNMSIREVISLAKEKEMTHLAITDHDTTKGLKEAIKIGKELNVHIIPGIEISAFDYKRNKRAHILGYYVEPGHEALENLCTPMVEKRHQASYEMVNLIIEAGYDITWDQVKIYAKGSTAVYKQHIMHALIDTGHTDKIYGDLYKELFARPKNGKQGVAFLAIDYINVEDAIQAIREAGGLPVLAHPAQLDNFDAVPEWVEIGLEGIEVKHPDHNKEDEVRAIELADTYDLVKTGGTDFHGFYGNSEEIPLGSINPGIESVNELEKRRKLRSAF